MARPPLDLQGRVFGRLTAVRRLPPRECPRAVVWVCRCACGSTVRVPASNLKSGNTTSCGCFKREHPSRLSHGQSKSNFYAVWSMMKQRCENPRCAGFSRYGGRGISVCKAWGDFDTFARDMQPSFFPGATLERKDNDGPYSKANCRWATRREQGANTRRNRRLSFNGKTMHVNAWARALGVRRELIKDRLYRGWSVEDALAVQTPACLQSEPRAARPPRTTSEPTNRRHPFRPSEPSRTSRDTQVASASR